MKLIYLHGFASGPSSTKAQFFKQRFRARGIPMSIPDLDGGDFENLTISSQLRVVEAEARGEAVSLIGSSMGGYLTALYASLHAEVRRVVLLAPAFGFARRWPDSLGPERVAQWRREGRMEVFHYGEQRTRMLGYALLEDGERYPDYPEFSQPALIFHGSLDTVVPCEYSRGFAAAHGNVRLRILESGHELTDMLDTIGLKVEAFLSDSCYQ